MKTPFVLLLHAGAGTLPNLPGFSSALREGLAAALDAGGAILGAEGHALDAVEAAVARMEDCPEMNAGTGGVLNELGRVELDAAIMCGSTRRAGAVAGLDRIRHPVAAARALLEEDRWVLVAGAGAQNWALTQGLEPANPEDFVTEFQRETLRRVQERLADAEPGGGTVGAVALDANGRLAAATSTGGRPGKREGRVSDSALIGSGTWADDATCAVSATGDGEFFIRSGFARGVDGRVRYGHMTLEAACSAALEETHDLGGTGGCIAIDARGNAAFPCNTPAMPRALLRAGDAPQIALAANEPWSDVAR